MFVGRLELSVGVIVVAGETSLGGEPPDARARRAGGLYRPIMPSPCNSRALQGIEEAEGKRKRGVRTSLHKPRKGQEEEFSQRDCGRNQLARRKETLYS